MVDGPTTLNKVTVILRTKINNVDHLKCYDASFNFK